MRRYLDVKNVAHRYGIAVSTVWQWVKDGIFPAPIRFGQRCTRWDSEELDEHDEKQKTEAV